MSVNRTLRWFAVVPAGLLGWVVAIITGISLLSLAESSCPADQRISDLCVAPWFRYAEGGIFIFSTALAGLLLVFLPAITAPSHRRVVAWVAFSLGTLTALAMGWEGGATKEIVSAITGGLLTAWWMHRRYSPD